MKKLFTILFILCSYFSYGQSFDFLTRGNFYKSMRVYDSTAVANAIAAAGNNIANFYLKDSSFSSDRTIGMNGKILAFQQGGSDLFNIDPAHGVVITSADGSSSVSAQSTFGLKHAGIGSGSESISLNGTDNTTVIASLSLSINNAYSIPVVDGTPNQVLTTDGLGTASWQSVTTGTVTNVSGTTNRITSTGGATPVIDISSTFEGLLVKKTDSSTSSVSNYVTQYQRKKTSDSLQANINANTTAIGNKWGLTGSAATAGTSYVGTNNNVSTLIGVNGVVKARYDSVDNYTFSGKATQLGLLNFNPVNLRSTQWVTDGSIPYAFRVITDKVTSGGLSIEGYGASTGGVFFRSVFGMGTPTTPLPATAGSIFMGLGSQVVSSDSVVYGTVSGFHYVLKNNPTPTNIQTEQQYFVQNGTSGRRYSMFLRSTGTVDFFDSTSLTWNPIRTGLVTVNGGTIVDQTNALKITATLPSGTASTTNYVANIQATSVNNTQAQTAINADILAGGTEAKIYAGGRFASLAAGTGANLFGIIGNYGSLNASTATTVGYNVGAYSFASGGLISAAFVGRAITAKNASGNIGGAFTARNTGTTPKATGVYAGMDATDPTFLNTALQVNNSDQAYPIALFQDNGTTVVSIADGGAMRIGDATGATDKLEVTGNIALTTAGNKIKITEGSNGSVGQTTLVSGTKAITITGLATSSRAQVTFVSIGGTVTTTWQYAAVCTANTLTITALTTAGATNTNDTSILNYWIVN